MAMTPEAKVKKKVAEALKKLGVYYFYPVTGGYGRSGVPDIVGCYNGKFLELNVRLGRTHQQLYSKRISMTSLPWVVLPS